MIFFYVIIRQGGVMEKIFFVNFVNKVNVKVVGDEQIKALFEKFLPYLIYDDCKDFDYCLNIHRELMEVQVPKGITCNKAFAASDFYCWQKDGVNYAYTDGNKFASRHFVVRNGKNIDLYFDPQSNIEIAIKVLREIILRELFKQGYVPIHSAGFEKNGETYVFFGGKNAGKSTSLLLFCKGLGFNPVTNDLSFLKIVGEQVEVLGWFYKISYQTRAQYLLINRAMQEVDNKKTKIFPLDFVKNNNLHWTWQSKLCKLVYVKCNYFIDSYEFKKAQDYEKQEYKPFIYDDWGFCDYLNIYNEKIDIDSVYDKLPIYSLTGNIAQYCIEKSLKEVLKEQYFDGNFEIKKVKLGTGNNFKVNYKGKKYFAKVIFFEENQNKSYAELQEINVYNLLKKSNVPIKDYYKTKTGKFVGIGSNYYVVLQEWVDGETMDNFEGQEDYLMQCARCLANINICLKPLNLEKKMLNLFDRFDFIIDKTQELLDKLELKPHDDNYYKVKKCLQWKIDTLKMLSNKTMPDINKFTYCNSHGDFSILQTIKRDGKLYKVIDFETVSCVPIIWEVFRSFVLSDIDAGKCILNKARLNKYLQEYRKINPLSSFDLENKYKIFFIQLLQSNFGFYNYIEQNNPMFLNFAYWRINFSKVLLKEIQNENRI